MARAVATTTIPKRRGIPFVPTVALSLWRLRQTWRLLLISGLGVLAAVVLVCAVPLFSEVAMSAGLRLSLQQFPNGTSVELIGNVNPGQSITAADLRRAQSAVSGVVHERLGDFLAPGTPSTVVNLPIPLLINSSDPGKGNNTVQLVGTDVTGDTSGYVLKAGRLPAALTNDLELAISSQLAADLHLAVGDSYTFAVPGPTTTTITTHIVGILAKSPFDQSNGSGPGSYYGGGPGYAGPNGYLAVASSDTLLKASALLTSRGGNYEAPIFINWSFPLDLSHLSASRAGDLQNRLQDLSGRGYEDLTNAAGFNVNAESNVLYALLQYQTRVILAQIPIVLLLIQVVGLVLLFISLMVNLLIERQADAIAVLRSRGASRGLVLRTMTFQSIGVGLLALIGGPPLALVLVGRLAGTALSPSDRDALNVLTDHPLAAVWDVRWFALTAAICAVVAMVISTHRAAGSNVLSLRRESARSQRKPIWLRLNLDLIFAAVSILGYSAYSYLIQNVPTAVKPFLSVLSLFGVTFLLLAIALLFLRFFPLLLRLLARIATSRRTAAPVLAIGQMARSPRQASRMTLLLALSTAFALFALIFSASQAQRVRDVAAYQTAADFRGEATPKATGVAGQRDLEAKYAAISGVTAAAAVYNGSNFNQSGALNSGFQLLAVNPDTFGRVAIWGSQESNQPLASVMAQLKAADATASAAIPAVVDDVIWKTLRLAPGAQFSLIAGQNDTLATRFVAVAHVAHIPPATDGPGAENGNGQGCILVDLATFNALYSKAQGDDPAAATHLVTPNEVWLQTADDAASLASVRAALSTGPLQLTNPSQGIVAPIYAAKVSGASASAGPLDRRQRIADEEADALHIDLISVLAIAAATALILALVGILLGSWISARNRLTSFALLRALGSEPRQLASTLLWEQGIVYALSLGLGVLIGGVLSFAVLPAIIFTGGAASRGFDYQQFVNALDVPPIQTVIPWQQVGLVLGALVAISLISILLMTAQVARPSISQTLRLNED